MASNIMPGKCCCCSLRTGSIVVGALSLIVALTFMGVTAAASSAMSYQSCEYISDNNEWKTRCSSPIESQKIVSNLMAFLAIMNAVEVVTSVGLIWGASKRIMGWIKGWLISTASWTLLHGAVALAYLFASPMPGLIILVSVLGAFVLGLALLAFLTVLSFHNEMVRATRILSPLSANDAPTALLSDA